jgi:hypothetical protein
VAASKLPTRAQGNVKQIISDDLTQQIRKGYAEVLKLNVDEALLGKHDTEINIAIGVNAIKNKQPTYKDLNGTVQDTNFVKRQVFGAFGGVNPRGGVDPSKWSQVFKQKYWDPTPDETRDLIDGKYDPTPTEPQKTSSGAYFTIDPTSAAARVRLYTNSYGTDRTDWQRVVRLAAGLSPIENARQLEYVNRFVTYFNKNGSEWWKWTEEEQKNAGLVGKDALFGRNPQPVAALTPAEDQELKRINDELSKLTAQHKKIEDYEKNNSEAMSEKDEEKLLKDLSDIGTKLEPLFKRKNELESKMQQNNTGGTKPDVASPVATQKPNASGSMPTKPPTGKNEKYDNAKNLYNNALSEFKDLNNRIKMAYDDMEEVEQWKADSEAKNNTQYVEDAAKKIEDFKQDIERMNREAEELKADMNRYKKNMEEAQKEGNK